MKMTLQNDSPRPDFRRKEWLSLNGSWNFSFDAPLFDQTIQVPFCYESRLSGIGKNEFHNTVWYRKAFCVPEEYCGKHVILHFGAVDYSCSVWVNDILVCTHIGGQSAFSADITDALNETENLIVLKAQDDHKNLSQPRGKQFWEIPSRSIFYTPTTGIWRNVWLEFVEEVYLESIFITPLLDEKSVCFDYVIDGSPDAVLKISIQYEDRPVTEVTVTGQSGSITVLLNAPTLQSWNFVEDLTWSPETPRLFTVRFDTYHNGKLCDTVDSYFGMRKISVSNGKVQLNNRPYYQKLILDQGYWPESLMTAPSDEAMIKDLQLIKDMGFNGIRMHQKVEDPRFYYHADRMGLLIWAEYGAAYVYSRKYAIEAYNEWANCVLEHYNHPSIIAWVPLNESWGILEINENQMQQAHSRAMYCLTKSLDRSRIVIDNDGWEHTFSDFLTIHDYESDSGALLQRYEDLTQIHHFSPGGRPLYVQEFNIQNIPILLTEFGGIRFNENSDKGWGYSSESTKKGFLVHFQEIVSAVQASSHLQGYCYTQFCDIETEENGLLYYDRTPKIALEEIKRINSGRK